MGAGDRQHYIEVEKATTTKNTTTNERIATWEEFCGAWVAVEARRGREFFEKGQRFNQTVIRFTFDFHDADGITVAMRIKFEGAYYDITQIIPDYAGRQNTVIDATLSRAGANA